MPLIVITVDDDGSGISISVNPREVTAQSNSRDLFWVLESGTTGWDWLNPTGIVLSTDPPSSIYSPWTGAPAQAGEGNSYSAMAPDPSGTETLHYKYTINLLKSPGNQTMRIDPDIANDPAG